METGQTIAGKYRLNRALGTGGMAAVWSATNVFTEREFAVKFLLPHVASTPEAARRFLLEAKVSARVNHPNIIEVFDVGQADDGALFLVMELLQGVSLETAIRQQKPAMRVHEFLRIMTDVAQALSAAHRSGVIHRDLKPSNVFLHRDRDGQTVPKVLDFGVSKFVDEDGAGAMTMIGTILGSPLYMSPEQAVGAEGIDGRTDIFAFGAILFEALSGERAYSALNLSALIVAIATTQPKRIEEAAPALAQPLKDLIGACMMTDKTRRLSSFAAVAESLTPVVAVLADSDLRLPSPRRSTAGITPASDGRAKRTSDRPPSLTASGSTTPAPDSPTLRGASTPGSLSWPAAREASGDGTSPTRTWIGAVGALGVLALLALAGGGLVRTRSAGGARHAAVAEPDRPPSPEASATAASASPEDRGGVPIISVDELPVAARSGAAKSGGRLSVAATPGGCSIFVDGTPHGSTPLRSFELTSGAHRLDCVPASGSAKAAMVTVSDGTEAHYQFTLAQ